MNIEALQRINFSVFYISESSRTQKEITLTNEALKEFKSLDNIPEQLQKNVEMLHFDLMTPIQRAVIPYMIEGNDIMGCSETGSGKTIAYLFPVISNMIKMGPPILEKENTRRTAFPITLVLVPTRELADQVYKESKKLCNETGINTVKIYGGVAYEAQLNQLSLGCDILVATPGRLIDYLKSKTISLKAVSMIIIDEADRILDMGFEEQLNTIFFSFDLVNKEKRQNLMFSATFSPEIRKIARKFMRDFYFVQPKNATPKQIKQEIIKTSENDKDRILANLLSQSKGSIIIFTDTKKRADLLSLFLSRENFRVCAIHGDKKQFQRQSAINNFTNGRTPILIATDVASRGLDFPNVNMVINYDLPKNLEDYIHRIGRTGRMGQEGTAVSLISGTNEPILKKLLLFFKEQNQEIPKWFQEMYNDESHENRIKRYQKGNNSFKSGFAQKQPFSNFPIRYQNGNVNYRAPFENRNRDYGSSQRDSHSNNKFSNAIYSDGHYNKVYNSNGIHSYQSQKSFYSGSYNKNERLEDRKDRHSEGHHSHHHHRHSRSSSRKRSRSKHRDRSRSRSRDSSREKDKDYYKHKRYSRDKSSSNSNKYKSYNYK